MFLAHANIVRVDFLGGSKSVEVLLHNAELAALLSSLVGGDSKTANGEHRKNDGVVELHIACSERDEYCFNIDCWGASDLSSRAAKLSRMI